jgi:hypothetical protein
MLVKYGKQSAVGIGEQRYYFPCSISFEIIITFLKSLVAKAENAHLTNKDGSRSHISKA